ncbi:MAG: hypothetical protein A3K14_06290 [Sulfurimonas sp. RIFCSPLOWO2_12_FULL_36_74]|uniref:hypothetical protein n=1 Tax=Sulfurimonas sp. RIFCSPLOWO2_12_36_12 TaxID=1802253 RepID=UPI0008AD428B|nr:hypothetical protein [Sulfurimonas sp. RIFCSPLOWO2_12_36_12]OHE00973.1 MAG: hypothetical protein A3J26_03010 [Sulfurimonas sp. RIFCSPLOWO2_02_FULL_36_28]OHE01354.1 MAG: hypothetical protein A2W82_01700 [Sulfurimonas sp. RIFCSPLOWO2_12_36_12]OHE08535.1 MAG: hypothetical protein A3K14_06290 [Sulfurimonas sp. RIFCSPLOWO2_12_FULL_36_74]
MKIIFSLTALIASLSAFELIHISNSVELDSLKELQDKYKKDIVISDSRAYIVPSECLLVRHFGGLSQNRVNIVGQELQSGYLSITQEVFEAKDFQTIKKEIEKQKISDGVEAKVAKAFLDDKDGHLFGGLSQGAIDLRAQKEVVKERSKEKAQESYKHPSCKLLDDGSGYMLFDAKDAKLYKSDEIKPLQTSTILFN